MAGAPSTTVYRARRILTMDASGAVEAIAVSGDRVVGVGRASELLARFAGAESVDLGDAVVVPGFNDTHAHLAVTSDDILHLDLSWPGVDSVQAVMDRVREAARVVPAGEWIKGNRYDDAKMRDGLLTREHLDAAAPDHPVWIRHIASHWGVASSRALALGGIDDASEPPPGGRLGRDAAGRLNGMLFDQAAFDFAEPAASRTGTTVVPFGGDEDRLTGMARVIDGYHEVGLTSVTDALSSDHDLVLYRRAAERGAMTVRLGVLVSHEQDDAVRDVPIGARLGDEKIRLAGIKAIVDGAVGGRTCFMDEPFEGSSDDFGIQSISTDALNDVVRAVHERGQRIAIHANGDRAIRLALDAVRRANEAMPRPDARHRIEHGTIVDEDILRTARLGMASLPHGSYVHYHGSKLLEWFGERRVQRMFAHRWLLDLGIATAGTSDWPCGPLSPLLAMQSCVTRRGFDGAEIGVQQRITPLEALSLYTTRAAEIDGLAHEKGRLAPGYLADFTVLDDDPLTVAHERIGSIAVLATYVGGDRVYAGLKPGGSRTTTSVD